MRLRLSLLTLSCLVVASRSHAQCLNWSTEFADNSPDNGSVYAIASHDDGSGPALCVGGSFTSSGGVPASRIAKWNGTSWSALGSGLDSTVYALAALDEGSGPALFVGGSFSNAGGAPAAALARWNNSSWTAVPGLHPSPVVNALLVHDFGAGPVLYVGGTFDGADLAASKGVVAWDGATWSSVGGGVDGSVQCLAVFDDGGGPALYVGGTFATAGGVPANSIAKWDGSAWSSLGAGSSGQVDAMAVYDEGSGPALFALGSFGAGSARIARWNGSSWSSLASEPVANALRALTTFDDGSGPALYVGGRFQSPGRLVTRWNGTTWSALGFGLGHHEHYVEAFGVHDDQVGGTPDLYAGGNFLIAAQSTSRRLAKWNACTNPVDTFCFGDATFTWCPCSYGAPRHGCDNSEPGFVGAILSATGNPSLGNDTLALHAADEKPSAFTIFLQGDALIPAGVVFGDGLRCAGGQLKRLYSRSAVLGAVDAPILGDPSISARSAALGDPLAVGSTRYYQTYYRDPSPTFCASGGTFNSTNGVRVVWQN